MAPAPLQISDAALIAWIQAAMWPFIRILGVLLVAPVFGGQTAPKRVRLIFAVALAFALAPLLPPAAAQTAAFSADWWFRAAHETLIGIAMGFVLQLVFEGAMLGGELIGYGMGLGFSRLVDPLHGSDAPMIGMFLRAVLSLLFLATGAHLRLIEALADSIRYSSASPAIHASDALALARFGSQTFEAGLLIALPVIAALMLVNLAFGVMSRAAPSLNATSVGFPMTLIAGLILLKIDLPVLLHSLDNWLEPAFRMIGKMGTDHG